VKNSAAVFLLLLLMPARSLAWGREGHRLVADIAQARLTATARLELKQLLGDDDLAAISVWADDIRHDRPNTYGWHFVDIPKDASGFSEARDCFRPDERYAYTLEDHHNCVVDRITMFEQVLAARNAPQQERIEALKFLVHFVADVHQPLHAMAEARGGNDIHIVEFGSSQCGKYTCNLHQAWDTGLIEHTGFSEAEYVAKLNQLITRKNLDGQSKGSPEDWANESFGLAKKVWLSDGGSVDEQYYRNNIGVVDERLALAGVRLAAMLNQALGK
jgi:S1/P1 Nuclease